MSEPTSFHEYIENYEKAQDQVMQDAEDIRKGGILAGTEVLPEGAHYKPLSVPSLSTHLGGLGRKSGSSSSDNPYGLTNSDIKALYLEQYENRDRDIEVQKSALQKNYADKIEAAPTADEKNALQEAYIQQLDILEQKKQLNESGYYFTQPLERYNANPYNPFTLKMSKLDAKRFDATATLAQKMAMINGKVNATVGDIDGYHKMTITMLDADTAEMHNGILGGKEIARFAARTGKYDEKTGTAELGMFDGSDNAKALMYTEENAAKISRQSRRIRQLFGLSVNQRITSEMTDMAKTYDTYSMIKKLKKEADTIEAFNMFNIDKYKDYIEKNRTFDAYVKVFDQKDKYDRKMIDIANMDTRTSMIAEAMYNPAYNAAYSTADLMEHFQNTRGLNETALAIREWNAEQIRRFKADEADKNGYPSELVDVLQGRIVQLLGSVPAFFDVTEELMSKLILGEGAGAFRDYINDDYAAYRSTGVKWQTFVDYNDDIEKAKKLFQQGDIASAALIGAQNVAMLIAMSLPDMMGMAAMNALTGGISSAMGIAGKAQGFTRLLDLTVRQYISGAVLSGTSQSLQDMADFKRRNGREMTGEEALRTFLMNGAGMYLESALSGRFLGRFLPNPTAALVTTGRAIAKRTAGEIGASILEEMGTEAVQEYIQGAISGANVRTGDYWTNLTQELGRTDEYGFNALLGAISGGVMSGVSHVGTLVRMGGEIRNNADLNRNEYQRLQTNTTSNFMNGRDVPLTAEEIQASHNKRDQIVNSLAAAKNDIATDFDNALKHINDYGKDIVTAEATSTASDYGAMKRAWNDFVIAVAEKENLTAEEHNKVVDTLFDYFNTDDSVVFTQQDKEEFVTQEILKMYLLGSSPSSKILNPLYEKELALATKNLDENTPIYEGYLDISRADQTARRIKESDLKALTKFYQEYKDPNTTEEDIKKLLNPEYTKNTVEQVHQEALEDSARGNDIVTYNIQFRECEEALENIQNEMNGSLATLKIKRNSLPFVTINGVTKNIGDLSLQEIHNLLQTNREEVLGDLQQAFRKIGAEQTLMNFVNDFEKIRNFYAQRAADFKRWKLAYRNKVEAINVAFENALVEGKDSFETSYSTTFNPSQSIYGNFHQLVLKGSNSRKMYNYIIDEYTRVINSYANYVENAHDRGLFTDEDYEAANAEIKSDRSAVEQLEENLNELSASLSNRTYGVKGDPKTFCNFLAAKFIESTKSAWISAEMLRRQDELKETLQAMAKSALKKDKITDAEYKAWAKKHSKLIKSTSETIYQKVEDDFKDKGFISRLTTYATSGHNTLEQYATANVSADRMGDPVHLYLHYMSDKTREHVKQELEIAYQGVLERQSKLEANDRENRTERPVKECTGFNFIWNLHQWLANDKRMKTEAPSKISQSPHEIIRAMKKNQNLNKLHSIVEDKDIQKLAKDLVGDLATPFNRVETTSEEKTQHSRAIEILNQWAEHKEHGVTKCTVGNSTCYFIPETEFDDLEQDIQITVNRTELFNRELLGGTSKLNTLDPAMVNGVENMSATPYYNKLPGKKPVPVTVRVYQVTSDTDIDSAYKVTTKSRKAVHNNSTDYQGIDKESPLHFSNKKLKVEINGKEIPFSQAIMAITKFADNTDTTEVANATNIKDAAKLYNELSENGTKTVSTMNINGVEFTQDELKEHPSIAYDWLYYQAVKHSSIDMNSEIDDDNIPIYELNTDENLNFSNARAAVLAKAALNKNVTTKDDFIELYGKPAEDYYTESDEILKDAGNKYSIDAVQALREKELGKDEVTLSVSKQDLINAQLVDEGSLQEEINQKLDNIFPRNPTVLIKNLNSTTARAAVKSMTLEQKRDFYTAISKMQTLEYNEAQALTLDTFGTTEYTRAILEKAVRLVDALLTIPSFARAIEKKGLGSSIENYNHLSTILDLDNPAYKRTPGNYETLIKQATKIDAVLGEYLADFLNDFIDAAGDIAVEYTAIRKGYALEELRRRFKQGNSKDFFNVVQEYANNKVVSGNLGAIFDSTLEVIETLSGQTIRLSSYSTGISTEEFNQKYQGKSLMRLSTAFDNTVPFESGVSRVYLPNITIDGKSPEAIGDCVFCDQVCSGYENAEEKVDNVNNLADWVITEVEPPISAFTDNAEAEIDTAIQELDKAKGVDIQGLKDIRDQARQEQEDAYNAYVQVRGIYDEYINNRYGRQQEWEEATKKGDEDKKQEIREWHRDHNAEKELLLHNKEAAFAALQIAKEKYNEAKLVIIDAYNNIHNNKEEVRQLRSKVSLGKTLTRCFKDLQKQVQFIQNNASMRYEDKLAEILSAWYEFSENPDVKQFLKDNNITLDTTAFGCELVDITGRTIEEVFGQELAKKCLVSVDGVKFEITKAENHEREFDKIKSSTIQATSSPCIKVNNKVVKSATITEIDGGTNLVVVQPTFTYDDSEIMDLLKDEAGNTDPTGVGVILLDENLFTKLGTIEKYIQDLVNDFNEGEQEDDKVTDADIQEMLSFHKENYLRYNKVTKQYEILKKQKGASRKSIRAYKKNGKWEKYDVKKVNKLKKLEKVAAAYNAKIINDDKIQAMIKGIIEDAARTHKNGVRLVATGKTKAFQDFVKQFKDQSGVTLIYNKAKADDVLIDNFLRGIGSNSIKHLKKQNAIMYGILDNGITADAIINLNPYLNQDLFSVCSRNKVLVRGLLSPRYRTGDELKDSLPATSLNAENWDADINSVDDLMVFKDITQTDDDFRDDVLGRLILDGVIDESERDNYMDFDNIVQLIVDNRDSMSTEVEEGNFNSVYNALLEQEEDDDTEVKIDTTATFLQAISANQLTPYKSLLTTQKTDEDLKSLVTSHSEEAEIEAALAGVNLDTLLENAARSPFLKVNFNEVIAENLFFLPDPDYIPSEKEPVFYYLYYAAKMWGNDYLYAIQRLYAKVYPGTAPYTPSNLINSLNLKDHEINKVNEEQYNMLLSICNFKTYLDEKNKNIAHLVYTDANGSPVGIIITTADTLPGKVYAKAKLIELNSINLATSNTPLAVSAMLAELNKKTAATATGINIENIVDLNDAKAKNELDDKYTDFYNNFQAPSVDWTGKEEIPNDYKLEVSNLIGLNIDDVANDNLVSTRDEIVKYITYAHSQQEITDEQALKQKLAEVNTKIKSSNFYQESDNYKRISERNSKKQEAAQRKQDETVQKKADLYKAWQDAIQNHGINSQEAEAALEEYTNFVAKSLSNIKREVKDTLNTLNKELSLIDSTNSILTESGKTAILKKLSTDIMDSVKSSRRDGVWLGESSSIMEQLKLAYANDIEAYEKAVEYIQTLKEKMSVTFDRAVGSKLAKDNYVARAMISFVSQQISDTYLKDSFRKEDPKSKKNKQIYLDDLTYEQRVEILAAMMASDPSFNIMYKVEFTSTGNIRIELRDEVALAMIAAASEVGKTCTDIRQTDAETAGRMLLGKSNLSDKEQMELKSLINHSGVMKMQVENLMGTTVLTNLGIRISPKDTDRLSSLGVVADNIGTFAYEMLQSAETNEKGSVYVQETTVDAAKLKAAGFSTKNSLTFVKIRHQLGEFGAIANKLTDNIFIDTTYVPETIMKGQPFPDTDPRTTIDGGFYDSIVSNKESLDFLNAAKQIPYEVDWDILNAILDHEYEYALCNDYKTEAELSILDPNERLAAEGKNNTVTSNINVLKQLKALLESDPDADVFFDWEQTIAGRFQIKGSIFDPQANKVLRAVLKPKAGHVKHNIKDKIHNSFENLALAQAFDCMDGKKRQGMEDFKNYITKDVNLAEEFFNDVATLSTEAIEIKYAKWNIGIEERSLALQAANHLVKRAKALANGQSEFETNLFMENDSTTSGYFLKLLLFPHPAILNAYGLKVGTFNSVQEYQQKVLGVLLENLDIDELKKLDGFLDIYRTGAVGVAENLELAKIKEIIGTTDDEGNYHFNSSIEKNVNKQLLQEFDKSGSSLSWDKIKMKLPQATYKEGVGYEVKSELRSLLKPVIMVFGYSAGAASIKRKTGEELYKTQLDLLRTITIKDHYNDLENYVANLSQEELEELSGVAALFALNLTTKQHDGDEKEGIYKGLQKKKVYNKRTKKYDKEEDSIYEKALIDEKELVNKPSVLTNEMQWQVYCNLRKFQFFYDKAIHGIKSSENVTTPIGEVEATIETGFSLDDVMVTTNGTNSISYADAIRNYYAETYGALVLKALEPFRPFVQVNNANNLIAGIGTSVYEEAFNSAEKALLIKKNPKLMNMTPDDDKYEDEVAKARSMITVGEWKTMLFNLHSVFPTGANYWTKDSVSNQYTPGGISIIDYTKGRYNTEDFLTRLGVYSRKGNPWTNLKIFSTDSRSTWNIISGAGLRLSVFSVHSFDASVLNATAMYALNQKYGLLFIHDALFMPYQLQEELGKMYNGTAMNQAATFNMLTSNIKMLKRILEAACNNNDLSYKYDLALVEGDTAKAESLYNEIEQKKTSLRNIARDAAQLPSVQRQAAIQLTKLEKVRKGRGTNLSVFNLSSLTKSTLMSFMEIEDIENEEKTYTADNVYESITLAELLKRMDQLADYYENPVTGVKQAFFQSDAASMNLAAKSLTRYSTPSNTTQSPLSSGPEQLDPNAGEAATLLSRADASTEGILDLMDKLIDHSKDSNDHINRLKGLIGNFLNLDNLNGWMVQAQTIAGNTRGQADPVTKTITLQRQGTNYVTSKKFNQSDFTVYAHELIHALFNFAFSQQTNMRISGDITRLRAIYNYVIKNKLMSWEDFLYDKNSITNQHSTDQNIKKTALNDIKYAHEVYDYLFNNTNTASDTGLQEFLSYLLTNPMMYEKFSKIKIQVGKQNRNLFQWVADIATKIFKVVTLQLTPAEAFEDLENKMSGYNLESGVDVYTSAVKLCLDIQRANTHAGNAMERAAGLAASTANLISGIRDEGNKIISPMLNSITDIKGIAKFVNTSKGGKLGILSKALLTVPFNETSRKAVGRLFRFYGEHITDNWVNSLLDDFRDGEFGIHQIEKFGRKTQKLEQDLQNITNQHKQWIREAFEKTPLSQYDEESLSVLLRGNIDSLLHEESDNIDSVIELLRSEQARREAAKAILDHSFGEYSIGDNKNKTIRSSSRLTTLVKNVATEAAAVMTCGKGNMLFSSYDNGFSFVLEKAKDTIDNILRDEYGIEPTTAEKNAMFYSTVASKIEQLASIYYLDHMVDRADNKAYLENCSKLDKKGIQYFLEMHKNFIASANTLLDSKEAEKERGLVPAAKNYDVMCDIKIAPISERETYEWNRYTLLNANQMLQGDSSLQIGNLTRNPDKKLGIYYKKALAPTRTDGSIVSLIGTHNRSYHVNTFLFECMSLDPQQVSDIRQAVEESSPPNLEQALKEAEIDNRIKAAKQEQYKKWIKNERNKRLEMLTKANLTFEAAKNTILSSSLDGDTYNPISYDDEVSFGMSRNAVELMSQMMATNEIADNSTMQNKVMIHILNNYYKENVSEYGVDKATGLKFVDIKKEMVEKFGYKGESLLRKFDTFYVREDWVKSLLGVESWSISNWKWKNTDRNVLPPTLNLAALYLENFLRLIAFKGKQGIVIKNPKVLFGNVASNINLHGLYEPNYGKIASMYKHNLENTIRYFNEKKEYDALINKQRHQELSEDEKGQVNRLKASMDNNPANVLIRENMYTNIVDDLTAIDQENMADIVQMFSTSKAVESIPEPVKKIARTIWMEKGTPLYETFYHINQYADFIARLTQYQLMMEKYTGSKDPQSAEYIEYRAKVLNDIWEMFIDYRIPTSRVEQYFNDIGLVVFTKYWRRIQRVIKSNVLKNPVGCLMQFARQKVFFSSNIFGSALPFKNYEMLFSNPYSLTKEAVAPRLTEMFGITNITD